MSYEFLTTEQKKHHAELQYQLDQESYEQECAYEIVRLAMKLFDEPDLRSLKNAMYLAHSFLNDELDQMPDEAQEVGLDVWIAKEKEDEEQEEQDRLDQEECEQQQAPSGSVGSDGSRKPGANGKYYVRHTHEGQEVIDPEGNVYARTRDEAKADRIRKLLSATT